MQFFLSEQRNFCATGETRAPGINHRDHHFLQVKSLYLDTIVASSKFLLTGGALLDEPSLPWRELFGQPSEALAGALRDGKFKAALENITPVGSELREPYGWQVRLYIHSQLNAWMERQC